jgi:hypothetical protein
MTENVFGAEQEKGAVRVKLRLTNIYKKRGSTRSHYKALMLQEYYKQVVFILQGATLPHGSRFRCLKQKN